MLVPYLHKVGLKSAHNRHGVQERLHGEPDCSSKGDLAQLTLQVLKVIPVFRPRQKFKFSRQKSLVPFLSASQWVRTYLKGEVGAGVALVHNLNVQDDLVSPRVPIVNLCKRYASIYKTFYYSYKLKYLNGDSKYLDASDSGWHSSQKKVLELEVGDSLQLQSVEDLL